MAVAHAREALPHALNRATEAAGVPASFYVPESETRVLSTEHTAGPWDPESQHGGPPAALLGRAVERTEASAEMQVARITFEILRPVPVASLEVSARVVREGKSVQLIEASLEDEAGAVMRALAWRIRTEDLELPRPDKRDLPAGPEEAQPVTPSFPKWGGYLDAMEWRFASGQFISPGPATAWIKMRIPLLPTEDPSPLSRVLAAADSASGISSVLDWDRWIFINPDLTVNLHRLPEGSWVGLEAATTIQPHGIGLARSTIYDDSGAIGAGAQTLYVAPRR